MGLYHANRGAHPYFLRIQQVPRPGDYVVNLIHYEDAADMAVKVRDGHVAVRLVAHLLLQRHRMSLCQVCLPFMEFCRQAGCVHLRVL